MPCPKSTRATAPVLAVHASAKSRASGTAADDAREILQRGRKRRQRRGRRGPRQDEPVAEASAGPRRRRRRRPRRATARTRIAAGLVAQRAGEAEDQVVPRLVGEEQRPGARQELGRIGELDNLHCRSLRCIGNA